MQGYRRYFPMILLLVFGLVAFGCNKAPKVVTSQEQKEPAAQTTEPTPEYIGLNVNYGDHVVVNLYVYLAGHLYLNGPKPVQILVPGNSPFQFEKNEFFVTRPVFPLPIKFSVPRGVPAGLQTIPLAMKLMYCNKSDDICIIKNDFVPVELMVQDKIGTVPKTHTIDKTYDAE